MKGLVDEVKLDLFGLAMEISESLGLGASRSQVMRGPTPRMDMGIIAFFSIVFFAFNWVSRLFIVDSFARYVLKMKAGLAKKFSQAVLEAVFYSTFTCIGALVMFRQPWVWPSTLWWDGWASGEDELMGDGFRCYYLLYISRYLMMCVSVILEPKRKDFAAMLMHHLVTAVVGYQSYHFSFNRIGSVTMLLLDPADVPLQIAKVSKYLADAKKSSLWQHAADFFFAVFAIVFFLTRLVMFSYACWSVLFESPYEIPNRGGAMGKICTVLLLALLALQFYWFYLIMRVAVKLFQTGNVEDVRSDDEAEGPATEEEGAARPPGSAGLTETVALVMAAILFVVGCIALVAAGPPISVTIGELQAVADTLYAAMLGPASAAAALPSSAPDLPRDRALCAALALITFGVNWGVRLLVVEKLIGLAITVSRSQLVKISQSIMEAAFYGGFMCLGLCVVPYQTWVWPSYQWWKGFGDGGHELMRADLRYFYILYGARYLQIIVSALLESKRKDFTEMMIHHIVTVAIIYLSYVCGWNRVGGVVMVLLDPADVPLHVAKLCKYMSKITGSNLASWFADRFFELFAVVFFITRLVLYGYVCWSAQFESSRYFEHSIPAKAAILLLYVIMALQIYWFGLVLKVAIRVARGQVADDPRSDDEADDATASSTDSKKRQ